MSSSSRSLPLVAIVTPVYNGSQYLERAIKCVQSQTYENIVHVILDNASTDATPNIIEKSLGKRIPLITARNEKLVPLTDNWDLAFAMIPREASFAKLLCADDLMRRDCIEKFVELCERDPSVETVACHDVYDDKVRRANIPPGVTVVDGRVAARAMLDRSINWLPYQHLFVRVHPEDFDKPFFGTGENGADPYAVTRSALRGKFGYLHEPLVYTRWHDNSASNNIGYASDAPLYSRQINATLLNYYKMMLVFGQYAWSNRAYKRALRFAQNHMVQRILWWRFSRFHRSADELIAALSKLGFQVKAVDYLIAILTVPLYTVWKRRWRTKTGPSVGENAFEETLVGS